jgi:hypothetical protein
VSMEAAAAVTASLGKSAQLLIDLVNTADPGDPEITPHIEALMNIFMDPAARAFALNFSLEHRLTGAARCSGELQRLLRERNFVAAHNDARIVLGYFPENETARYARAVGAAGGGLFPELQAAVESLNEIELPANLLATLLEYLQAFKNEATEAK